MCRLDPSLTPQYGSVRALGSPKTLIPRDEESSEEDRPLLPRFLSQEIICAHSPFERVFHNWQACKGIFCPDRTGFAYEEVRRQNA